MYRLQRTPEDIDDLLDRCGDQAGANPDLTYEDGIQDGILWVTGHGDTDPLGQERPVDGSADPASPRIIECKPDHAPAPTRV